MIKCNNCNSDLKPLNYYYDDDWGHKGNQVWMNQYTQEIRLFACPKCGNVQIRINQNKKEN